ncbi:apoptosis-antagonizing transcription factor [Irpex rosettiformis]|uniref:Apoptosis-antagonizing transcription factor n=1 Tax=Irpex rosettiformis TaxID=378272 RepID=A0ACB8TR03_9APHY|nr:apoptosis-antagonizing transcription factor [Irpex rosettiformis]
MPARVSLAQQIALLSQAAPADLDPEEIYPHSDSDSHADNAAATEHYLQVGPSAIRQANAALSDSKYAGTRVSRASLQTDREQDTTNDDDGIDEPYASDVAPSSQASEPNDDRAHVEARGPVVQHAPTHVSAGEEGTPCYQEVSAPGLASALRTIREQDRKKGKAVFRQITLWDTLLDARIRLHKGATSLNKFPLSHLQTVSEEQSVAPSSHWMLREAIALSEDITILQEALLRIDGTPSLSTPLRKRARMSHTGSERDYLPEFRALSADASNFEAAYHPHLIQTLDKWSAKIQAVSPSVLLPGNHSSFRSAMNGEKGSTSSGVVDVIDALLTTDAEELLARTRVLRGGTAEDEALDRDVTKVDDPNVFDDADFYQQLLRDVIESRGVGGETGEQEWIRKQKARKVKKKMMVDTRATKGRKLRYQVHEKLQNFMVPVPTSRGTWHEEQIDELFVSLFGCQN